VINHADKFNFSMSWHSPLLLYPATEYNRYVLIYGLTLISPKTGLDSRAKSAGFHKLKKLGKGEYEERY